MIKEYKYCVIMDYTLGAIIVRDYLGEHTVIKYNLKNTNDVWGYFNELPDIDESLILDSEPSYAYLVIFNFTSNKGIVIPITENEEKELENFEVINDCPKYSNICNKLGVGVCDYMITRDSEIYFNVAKNDWSN